MMEDPDRINAAALLLARGRPSQAALVCGMRTVPYSELRKAVARAARCWQDLGMRQGELVMVRGDHGAEHVAAFLGAIWAGAVPVPLRPAPGEHDADAVPVRYARPPVEGDARFADWAEWPLDFIRAEPLPPVGCAPWAPACWTAPRGRAGAHARVLPHLFALALNGQPGVLAEAPAPTMLAVLRTLRRGSTALLQPAARAEFA